jgi:PleD family two-component response regulator
VWTGLALMSEMLSDVHVVIAEDHKRTREALATILESKAFRVTAVPDGDQAVEVLTSIQGPCIALLDWMLPGTTGLEVCRTVRAQELTPHIYIIMITAREEEEAIAEALGAGADDFIRKPCGVSELVARVRNGQRTVQLERSLATRIEELEQALERVSQLQRLLPICMYCKKVRDDSNYWQEIEGYIHAHTGTDFSHGICPDCMDSITRGEKSAFAPPPKFEESET